MPLKVIAVHNVLFLAYRLGTSLIISGTANIPLGTLISLSLAQGTPVSLSLPRFVASLNIFVHKGQFWPLSLIIFDTVQLSSFHLPRVESGLEQRQLPRRK